MFTTPQPHPPVTEAVIYNRAFWAAHDRIMRDDATLRRVAGPTLDLAGRARIRRAAEKVAQNAVTRARIDELISAVCD